MVWHAPVLWDVVKESHSKDLRRSLKGFEILVSVFSAVIKLGRRCCNASVSLSHKFQWYIGPSFIAFCHKTVAPDGNYNLVKRNCQVHEELYHVSNVHNASVLTISWRQGTTSVEGGNTPVHHASNALLHFLNPLSFVSMTVVTYQKKYLVRHSSNYIKNTDNQQIAVKFLSMLSYQIRY